MLKFSASRNLVNHLRHITQKDVVNVLALFFDIINYFRGHQIKINALRHHLVENY